MNLSKRLEAVATLVDIGANVIDVGCDHAYLDIYLTLNNDNKCIATDINENALAMAKTNIKKYKLSKKTCIFLQNIQTTIYQNIALPQTVR
jgi:tRNA (adenine22-N1)-methyltransferase